MLGPDLLKDLEWFITKVQVNLKEAHDRQKIYTDNKRKDKYYQIGDEILLESKSKTRLVELRKVQ